MTENRSRKRRIILRCCSAALMIFAIAFGVTTPENYCLGGEIFAWLGLNAWSDGMQGTYYPGILALVLFAAACGLFVSTTKDKEKTKKHLIAWIVLIMTAAWLIDLI